MRWDLFCRVIDNHGDAGVCWRLARDLAGRGDAVRLWIDDARSLAWMAPQGARGVEVMPWEAAEAAVPLDVVVEAFGCDPPATFVARMAALAQPPVWINLEYLSAEDYVERSHRLPSPQSVGPGAGLVKWFFYPGFTAATGGLLRERGLLGRRAGFDAAAWREAQGLPQADTARLASLFCYPGAPLQWLVDALADRPTVLCAPGDGPPDLPAVRWPETVTLRRLPWLTQDGYDRLLWSCELNVVRGEDSFVRAMWAGAPFVWHVYPQHDGAHAAKLEAFARRFGAAEVPGLPALWGGFNGLQAPPPAWPDEAAWRRACGRWRERLAAQEDLTTQLRRFAADRSAPGRLE